MTDDEAKRIRQRDATRRYRATRKKAGIKDPPRTREQLDRLAEAQQRYRERQRALGEPPNPWAIKNRERHRRNVARWRKNNPERAAAIAVKATNKMRSTPWGVLNGLIFPTLRMGVKRSDNRPGPYTAILGYTWKELRSHIESQFTSRMRWSNWGTYWEIDHIKPLSSFRYETMSDPTFKEAWSLDNIRPLHWLRNRRRNIRHKIPN